MNLDIILNIVTIVAAIGFVFFGWELRGWFTKESTPSASHNTARQVPGSEQPFTQIAALLDGIDLSLLESYTLKETADKIRKARQQFIVDWSFIMWLSIIVSLLMGLINVPFWPSKVNVFSSVVCWCITVLSVVVHFS